MIGARSHDLRWSHSVWGEVSRGELTLRRFLTRPLCLTKLKFIKLTHCQVLQEELFVQRAILFTPNFVIDGGGALILGLIYDPWFCFWQSAIDKLQNLSEISWFAWVKPGCATLCINAEPKKKKLYSLSCKLSLVSYYALTASMHRKRLVWATIPHSTASFWAW